MTVKVLFTFIADPCAVVGCPVRTNALSSFTSVMSVPSQMALVSIPIIYILYIGYREKVQTYSIFSYLLVIALMIQYLSRLHKNLNKVMDRRLGEPRPFFPREILLGYLSAAGAAERLSI